MPTKRPSGPRPATAVGICGTPGTGKKTVAPLVGRLLGLRAVSLNSLAPGGAEEVDPADLRRAFLAAGRREAVVYGHLLPHVLRRGEARLVAVLRCEPSVLRKRLEARGYPAAKVRENVEAELIGVVLDECVRAFGEAAVREYDTTDAAPGRVAEAVARDASAPARRVGPWIDWTLGYGSPTTFRSLLEGKGPAAPT